MIAFGKELKIHLLYFSAPAAWIAAFDLEMSEDLMDVFPSKKDVTTPEMLRRAIDGHKAALKQILKICK